MSARRTEQDEPVESGEWTVLTSAARPPVDAEKPAEPEKTE